MGTMLVVPAGVAGHVREGLFGVLAPVCASLAQAQATSTAARRCGWQREPLACLDRVGALLDVLGRSAGEPPGRVMVDVEVHGWALLEALDCEVRVLERLVGEAMAYHSSGPGCRRLGRKLGVLRGFARAVEEQLLVARATPVDMRPWAGRGGSCVGDVEVVIAAYPGGALSLTNWATSPSPDLGGLTPAQTLTRQGGSARVLDALQALTPAAW